MQHHNTTTFNTHYKIYNAYIALGKKTKTFCAENIIITSYKNHVSFYKLSTHIVKMANMWILVSQKYVQRIYKMINHCSCFHGWHWRLEQGSTHVALHSPPSPLQHLQTIPSVPKIFEYLPLFIFIFSPSWESRTEEEEEEEEDSSLPSVVKTILATKSSINNRQELKQAIFLF